MIYMFFYKHINMFTRSKTKLIYEVNIDFDEAHEEWMKNKTQLANCTYKYICGKPTKRGGRCLKDPCCKVKHKIDLSTSS